MPVIKRTVEEGQSFMEQINERIRTLCEIRKEDFYGSCGCEQDVKTGFLHGLWIGCQNKKEN